ncbi:hypothetical protein [Paracidovorax avenae]|uniref:hypothetical protein n=1 Tax=Paracidovorax avenae TaxID=80867 RepID=UPI000D21A311|nr:hypothetical protein [Paracidovorax avenae]AVS85507.1 hypothetical protein C8239_12725 [Paracidovorax avenae]AVS96357.1 hypothetical protein C8232_08920 [Paracidovorax avenae]AVT03190.1 hypothetical protein C8243_12350 [Paracidovorax avenae]AVT10153.1 hypothetical protein C8242_12190 [Paracidovorax avenae]
MSAPAAFLGPRARDSLDRMMVSALQQSVVRGGGVAVQPVDALPSTGGATHMAVLSIASFSFRVVAALHFAHGPAWRAWVAATAGLDAGGMSDQAFLDRICEMGNLCCGAINRDLGAFQAFLGLSTPQILDARCAPYFTRAGFEHVRHFRMDVRPDLALHASLCARAYVPQDFHWAGAVAAAPEAVASGELELF